MAEAARRRDAQLEANARGARHAEAHNLSQRLQALGRFDHIFGASDELEPGAMSAPSEPGAEVGGVPAAGQMYSGNRHEVKQLQEGRGIVDYE